MDDLIELTGEIRDKCMCCRNSLSQEFDISEDSPPICAFNMVHNGATIALELLVHYRSIWVKKYRSIWIKKRERSPKDISIAREENGQRVMEVTKWVFTACLSSMEYSAKRALKDWGDPLEMDWSRRVYLSGIVEKSVKEGWIKECVAAQMDDILFVRNCLVHNNGVSDKKRTLFNPSGGLFEADVDQMLQSDLRLFLGYVLFACDYFQVWSRSMLSAR